MSKNRKHIRKKNNLIKVSKFDDLYKRICRSVQHFVCTKAHKKRKLDSCLMNIDCQQKGVNLCRKRLTGSTLICVRRNRNGYDIRPEIWKQNM